MNELVWIFISARLVNNFTLSLFLGLCSFLGVTQKMETAFRLGLANIFVMIITALAVSQVRKQTAKAKAVTGLAGGAATGKGANHA
jgi:Na+-translocating ferredoxin:NAD+ oxidoreductase RnfA subunit